MKDKVLIINSNYPSEENLYGDMFVHARARHYIKHFDVQVLGWNQLKPTVEYSYEGVAVKSFSSREKLTEEIISFNPDIILIHFVEGWMLESFIKPLNRPVIVWVHGAEALGWYRRIFNFNGVLSFGHYVLTNTLQMFRFRKLVAYSNSTGKVSFVFVSNWMKSITETDSLSKVKNYYIVPNPIDNEIFPYVEKNAELRKKILLIRSFSSKKYANDIAVNAIMELSKYDFFQDLEFNIYGVGKYFKILTQDLVKFKNVKLHNNFIENKSIPSIHKHHGIFLCPTRQDAQGVSMCEAMSSGLAPISSYNTAIPEFLVDGSTGYMTRSASEIAAKIAYLYQNPDKFLEISKKASSEIQRISGNNFVVKTEIQLIKEKITKTVFA